MRGGTTGAGPYSVDRIQGDVKSFAELGVSGKLELCFILSSKEVQKSEIEITAAVVGSWLEWRETFGIEHGSLVTGLAGNGHGGTISLVGLSRLLRHLHLAIQQGIFAGHRSVLVLKLEFWGNLAWTTTTEPWNSEEQRISFGQLFLFGAERPRLFNHSCKFCRG